MKRSYFEKLFSAVSQQSFSVTYWNGEVVRYGSGEPEFSLRLLREPSWFELVTPLSLFLGEAYMHGDLVLEGNSSAVAKALDEAHGVLGGHKIMGVLTQYVLPKLHSFHQMFGENPQRNIEHHYDLGNDFFKLWLDETTRSYSCAYFKQPQDSLDTAQMNKIELILKKMHLEPGMRLLDIGCGWGGLVQKAIEEYDVQALGITLSKEQFTFVKDLMDDKTYHGKGEVRLCSYGDLLHNRACTRPFDRIVSVGMFEHVGE